MVQLYCASLLNTYLVGCVEMMRMKVSPDIVGKTLARDVYYYNGNLLLPRGTVIEYQHVKQLHLLKYTEVMVEKPQDNIIPSAANQTDVSGQVYDIERHSPLKEVFAETADNFREMMSKATLGHKIRPQEVEETVDILFPGVMETNNILTNLRTLRNKDEYTLQHSVSVSILSLKMGQIMKLSSDDLKVLGMAALLHDIGKCNIPMDIINKPGRLTEEEFREIQKHPVFGYKTVQDNIQIHDQRVMLAVLQHHEHQNGKGYPLKLSAQQIHIFSSIIAVADVFDALTSDRPYRDGGSVYEALEQINASSVSHLHPVASRCLQSYIMNISPGEKVVLNNGEIGRVIMANKAEANRPLVQVGDRFINLSEVRYLWVEDFLS